MGNPTVKADKANREMDELANHFFETIERADFDELQKIYSPDVVYWMNAIPHTQNLDALISIARLFHEKVKNLHYEMESREFFDGGLVQRCRIKGEISSGEEFDVPLCLILYVKDGQIVRLYEYINPAPLMSVFSGH